MHGINLNRCWRIVAPLVGIILLWEFLARTGWISVYLLPRPQTVWQTFLQLLADGSLL